MKPEHICISALASPLHFLSLFSNLPSVLKTGIDTAEEGRHLQRESLGWFFSRDIPAEGSAECFQITINMYFL